MKKLISLICVVSACFVTQLMAGSNSEIKAVVFDFGGVIAYVDYSPLEEYLMNFLNLSKDELSQTVKKMLIFVENGGEEKLFWENYCILNDKQSVDSWFDQYLKTFKKVFVKIQGTEDIVKELKKNGYQTAMLSDVTKSQAKIVRELGYYSPFNPILLSCEIGIKKPDPKVFKLLLVQLNLPASAVIFVDDRSQNVEAAKKEGIDGIQFVTPEQLQKELMNRRILYEDTHAKNLCKDWMIGGKIHFEEQGFADYIGTVEINDLTRKTIKDYFDVQIDSCAHNAKALLKKENNQIILTHYEERSKPGIGEEIHATLLYTSKRVEDAHHTLRDIYGHLREVDATLPQDNAPTVKQVADAYQKIIQPDWRFQIADVEFINGKSKGGMIVQCIIAKLRLDGKDEILNNEGRPISGNFLHLTLANIDSSMTFESDKLQFVVSDLNDKLSGKMVKIGNKKGCADLEFGVSGSSERIRPQ